MSASTSCPIEHIVLSATSYDIDCLAKQGGQGVEEDAFLSIRLRLGRRGGNPARTILIALKYGILWLDDR